MTTPELISYLRKEINKNISKEIIISKLLNVGWHREDIDEGFLYLSQENTLKNQNSKIWIPRAVPVNEEKQIRPVDSIIKPIKDEEIKEQKIEIQYKEIESPKEELIPTLIPKKMVVNSLDSIEKDNLIKKEEVIPPSNIEKNSLAMNLPKSAMLSSYEKDVSFFNKDKNKVLVKQKKKPNFFKWILLFLISIIIFGLIWTFASGYINIKDINIPFIKKEPKVLLLNNSKVLASLNSYKNETKIEILSPSFSNISSGLVSGQAIYSTEKDSVSFESLSQINQKDGEVNSDSMITIKGSILSDNIKTNIKNNGNELFISIPEDGQIIKEKIPSATIIKMKGNQFDLILPLFSEENRLKLEKIDIYRILFNGMASYINNDNLATYNEFISNADIVDKGQETIKGVETYHYLINSDRQLYKKLLSKISDNLLLNLSSEDKNNLDQILGSVTVSSFDVWIGKSDNNIYQYNIVLDIPLSKILGFDDKSIGDNKLTLNLQSTYYDFNIMNDILMPLEYTPVEDFVRDIKIEKMKNNVLSFGSLATVFKSTEKSYGNKSNTNGSCMNPSQGSLFSPIGHSKASISIVSSISESLNKILRITKEEGFCYSTPSAWSFTVPLSDNYDTNSIPSLEEQHYFCLDSTGSSQELINPPTGVICK